MDVPITEDFVTADGSKVKYLQSEELKEWAQDLILAHQDELGHLRKVQVDYLWQASKASRGGKVILGTCRKPSGLLALYSQADFVIILNAHNLAELDLDDTQIEATLFHEMLHIGRPGEDGKRKTVPHDVEMFVAEVRKYGLWKADLKALKGLDLK